MPRSRVIFVFITSDKRLAPKEIIGCDIDGPWNKSTLIRRPSLFFLFVVVVYFPPINFLFVCFFIPTVTAHSDYFMVVVKKKEGRKKHGGKNDQWNKQFHCGHENDDDLRTVVNSIRLTFMPHSLGKICRYLTWINKFFSFPFLVLPINNSSSLSVIAYDKKLIRYKNTVVIISVYSFSSITSRLLINGTNLDEMKKRKTIRQKRMA